MNDSMTDIFLGGLLVNPAKVFTATSIPEFKGYRRQLYEIIREEFMDTTGVDPCVILTKMRQKCVWFTVQHIIELMDRYDDYVWRRKRDRMDYGQPYCPWPPDLDRYAERYNWLASIIGEERLYGILNPKIKEPARTPGAYYRDKFHYEESERWFNNRAHEYAKKLESMRGQRPAAEAEPMLATPPQPGIVKPITYDDLPF